MRCNLVIAIGDLAFRFPNLLEPWTANMYKPLADADDGARHFSKVETTIFKMCSGLFDTRNGLPICARCTAATIVDALCRRPKGHTGCCRSWSEHSFVQVAVLVWWCNRIYR